MKFRDVSASCLVSVCVNLWSTNTPWISRVLVSDTCQCLTPTRHLWLHWIMSFSQMIIRVRVRVCVRAS